MSVATLSAKRESFGHQYSASHNATAAAKAAGYSELRAGRTGYELLQRPDVAALVRELDAAKRAATGIDEPWIVDRLQSSLHTGTAWRFRAICPSLSSTSQPKQRRGGEQRGGTVPTMTYKPISASTRCPSSTTTGDGSDWNGRSAPPHR